MSTTVVQMSPAPPPKKDKPRPRRAQTAGPPTTTSSSTSSPAQAAYPTTPGGTPAVPPKPRRSHSQDQQAHAQQMTSSSGTTGRDQAKKKKASMHADVIDMMDYSGNARFHHDGPFDAVAPSRNRHPTRGPMGVFDLDTLSPSSGGGPYPTSAVVAAAAAPPSPLHTRARSSTQGPASPSVTINPAFISPAPLPDKKKNAVAEAWGIADPEPFEEFSAGAGYNNGNINNNNAYMAAMAANGFPQPSASSSAPSGPLSRSGAYNDYWNEGDAARNASRNARRTRTIPPPQQIMLPGSNFDTSAYRDPQEDSPGSDEKTAAGSPITPSAYGYAGTSPPRFKRTKSLMQRIRTMRENPNVPMYAPDPDAPDPVSPFLDGPGGYTVSPSLDEPRPILYASERDGGALQPSQSAASFDAPGGRSSHGKKTGMSLFNRLGRSPRQPGASASPPVSPMEESNGFVLIHSPRESTDQPRTSHSSHSSRQMSTQGHGRGAKALPSLPPNARSPPVTGQRGYEKDGYFDGGYASVGDGGLTPGGGHQLGRKRSLLSKMKGVTRK